MLRAPYSTPHQVHMPWCCMVMQDPWWPDSYQVHIPQEVLRPAPRVDKVLAVVVLLATRWPGREGTPGSPPSPAMPVPPSAWSLFWRSCTYCTLPDHTRS